MKSVLENGHFTDQIKGIVPIQFKTPLQAHCPHMQTQDCWTEPRYGDTKFYLSICCGHGNSLASGGFCTICGWYHQRSFFWSEFDTKQHLITCANNQNKSCTACNLLFGKEGARHKHTYLKLLPQTTTWIHKGSPPPDQFDKALLRFEEITNSSEGENWLSNKRVAIEAIQKQREFRKYDKHTTRAILIELEDQQKN